MWFLIGILGMLVVLIVSLYLLNKISTRKVNSFNLDANNSSAQSEIEKNRNQQNNPWT